MIIFGHTDHYAIGHQQTTYKGQLTHQANPPTRAATAILQN